MADIDEYDDEIDIEIITPNEDINLLMKDYSKTKKKYKTQNYLTKYEKTMI